MSTVAVLYKAGMHYTGRSEKPTQGEFQATQAAADVATKRMMHYDQAKPGESGKLVQLVRMLAPCTKQTGFKDAFHDMHTSADMQ